MSTGLPITCTPMNTISDMASTTNSAWISRRINQVVIQSPEPLARIVSRPLRLLPTRGRIERQYRARQPLPVEVGEDRTGQTGCVDLEHLPRREEFVEPGAE